MHYLDGIARLQADYARVTFDDDPRTDEELVGYDEVGLPR